MTATKQHTIKTRLPVYEAVRVMDLIQWRQAWHDNQAVPAWLRLAFDRGQLVQMDADTFYVYASIRGRNGVKAQGTDWIVHFHSRITRLPGAVFAALFEET